MSSIAQAPITYDTVSYSEELMPLTSAKGLALRRFRAYLIDSWAMAQAAGPLRILNVFVLKASFQLSTWLKKPIVWGYPFAASLEPTTSCNLRCPECLSGLRGFTRAKGMLSVDLATRILDQLRPKGFYINLYFQGEPYLNPDFLQITKAARARGFYVATSTNAHYLTQEMAAQTVASGLSRLIISLDGTTQETYESYRVGGKLSKVQEGIKNIVAAKKAADGAGPYLILQFLVVGPNEHQIEEARRWADAWGVDEIRFKTAQIEDYEQGNTLIPANAAYSRYRRLPDGTYRLTHKLEDKCWRMWSSLVVTWDARVVPCCFDKDAHHTVGNLATSSLSEIWTSNKYNNFRQQLFVDRSSIAMCQNCTEGTKVFEN